MSATRAAGTPGQRYIASKTSAYRSLTTFRTPEAERQRSIRHRPPGATGPGSFQSAKYFAASCSIVPFVRMVVEPSSWSIPRRSRPDSRMRPLGSQ